MSAGTSDRNGHFDSQEVALYAEGGLSDEQRAAVESHLADCEACRREVTEVSLFLQRKRSGRRGWLAPTVSAAAAAILLLVILWPGTLADDGDRALRESGRVEGLPSIGVVTPGAGSTVLPDSVIFAWRSAGSEAFYRLTLATEEGAVVWRQETADTTVTLPGETELERGESYYWFVDALLPDGREATTGVQRFRLER